MIPRWQDILVLKDLNAALEPVAQFTGTLSGEQYVTVSTIVPTLALFATEDFMGEKEGDSELKASIKKKMLKYMSGKYDDAWVKKIVNRSTLLDPRYKGNYIDADVLTVIKRDLVEEMSAKEIQAQQGPTGITAAPARQGTPEPPTILPKKIALSTLLSKVRKTTVSASGSPEDKARRELEAYLAFPAIEFEESPLEWWKGYHKMYPSLTDLAKKYLCIPATSSPSERVFSKAGGVVTAKRALLKPEKVNMLTFLSTNL